MKRKPKPFRSAIRGEESGQNTSYDVLLGKSPKQLKSYVQTVEPASVSRSGSKDDIEKNQAEKPDKKGQDLMGQGVVKKLEGQVQDPGQADLA